MHEIHLVKNLVSALEKEIESKEINEVKTIHLEVGKLQHITSDGINSCFKQVPRSEKLKNTKIEITVLPAKAECADCKKISILSDDKFNCKFCSGNNVKIVSGNEFNLKSIDW